ncbi:MAG: Crp/Fnr family transcriptional regulator [Bacteroidia bacterium]|nr:Crp/Fnr family transcriptional regulator [Bacteroidia bacterium]
MPDFTQFKEAIFNINPALSEEEWEYMKSCCLFRSFNKKEFVLKEGEHQTAIGFVSSGLLRSYYVDDKGNEITIRFVRENNYATHYSALINDQVSRYNFQCLEDSELILLQYDMVKQGYDKYKGIERFGRLIAELVLSRQQDRIERFQFLDAEERYTYFTQEYPDLFNRVSLSHLASYLGIQRPSLSRIRKKIAEEK